MAVFTSMLGHHKELQAALNNGNPNLPSGGRIPNIH